jgi:glycosyltransferase involved in cell wall biosynthesis
MRVAYLSFDFGEYSIRLANALARQTDVLLMLPRTEAAAYVHLLDPAVVFRPFSSPRLRQPLRQMRMLAGLHKEIRRFAPEIFHLQQGHLWFNLGFRFLPRLGFVLTVHDCRHHPGDAPSRKTPQWVLDLGYRHADEIIVHSNYVKQQLVHHCRISDGRVHVIPHIGLGEAACRKENNHRAPAVLFFGRIWEYKGLEYLIRAEPLITTEVPEAKIVIAGQGEEFSRYRKMMVHPERFVVHNEYISESDRAELFEQATVVALPYIEASQSGVIPLAYTHGKPVVGTSVGGINEMVEEGKTGLCVPPRDEKALANAIVRILKDHNLAQTLGANGQHKINSECSPSQVATMTVEVYRRAMHTRSLAMAS